MLDDVAKYEDRGNKKLVLIFDTEYRGKWQVRYDGYKLREFRDEPPIESLTAEEQSEIKIYANIAYVLTFGERPSSLSSCRS